MFKARPYAYRDGALAAPGRQAVPWLLSTVRSRSPNDHF